MFVCDWLELEQAPVDPVSDPFQQHVTSESQLQPSFPQTSSTQPLASGLEVVLPLEPLVDPVSSQPQHAGPPRVTQPPTFTLGLQNQTVTAGDAAVFTVFFEGQPRPSVDWYINGRLVHSKDVVVRGVEGVEVVEDLDRGTSTLTVLSSSVDNEDQYTCRVHNSVGTAFTNAHLFVLGKPFTLCITVFYSK